MSIITPLTLAPSLLPCFSAQESDVGDDVIKSLREALVEKDKFIQVKLTSN